MPNYCCCQCILVFFLIIFIVVGFVMTLIGHYSRPYYAPSEDWCALCKAKRLQQEENLKHCRIVGPIFLVTGGILFISSIVYCHVKRSANDGQVFNFMENSSTAITSNGTTTTTGISPADSKQTSNVQEPPRQNALYNNSFVTAGHIPPGVPSVPYTAYPVGPINNQPQSFALYEIQADGPPPSYDTIVGDGSSL